MKPPAAAHACRSLPLNRRPPEEVARTPVRGRRQRAQLLLIPQISACVPIFRHIAVGAGGVQTSSNPRSAFMIIGQSVVSHELHVFCYRFPTNRSSTGDPAKNIRTRRLYSERIYFNTVVEIPRVTANLSARTSATIHLWYVYPVGMVS